MKNQKVFLNIQINNKDAGKIVIELFSKDCPKTTQNFFDLCTGSRGSTYVDGKPAPKALTFQNSIFHRVIPGFMAQGGDFTNANGTGGVSIYGAKFNDENFIHKHTEPYMLSMANAGPNTNGSQFFLTFAPAKWLDGKHVVFGKVTAGFEIIQAIEKLGSNSGKVTGEVKIYGCGELKE